MTPKNRVAPNEVEPLIYFWIKAPQKKPLAMSLETHKLIQLVSILLTVVCLSVVGTLLFFRELEVNRKLGEELLALRLREKIGRKATLGTVKKDGAGVAVPAITAPAQKTISETSDTSVTARLTDLSVECSQGVCTAKVSMVPSKTGVAEGNLLLVLETEMLRIGTGTTGQARKRYFLYPHAEPRDELEETDLTGLAKKNFHFSRALQTTSTFNVGRAVRPIALNLYVFDTHGAVVHHERKTVEGSDAHADVE